MQVLEERGILQNRQRIEPLRDDGWEGERNSGGRVDKIKPDGWPGGDGCADKVPTRSRAWCGLKTDSSWCCPRLFCRGNPRGCDEKSYLIHQQTFSLHPQPQSSSPLLSIHIAASRQRGWKRNLTLGNNEHSCGWSMCPLHIEIKTCHTLVQKHFRIQ